MQEITHQDQNCDLKLSEKVLELDTDSLLRTLWIYFVTVSENSHEFCALDGVKPM